jgi:hypothetical protein
VAAIERHNNRNKGAIFGPLVRLLLKRPRLTSIHPGIEQRSHFQWDARDAADLSVFTEGGRLRLCTE